MQQACAVWEGRKQATVMMEKEQGKVILLSNGLKDSPGCEQLTTKDMKTVLGVVSCNAEST